MSTFVQHNKGTNSKGTQTFSSQDKDKFRQYGGGVQIIDGVPTHTQNVAPNEVAFQTPLTRGSEGASRFVQNVNGGIAFQCYEQTNTYH
jgi:hypothetical protein